MHATYNNNQYNQTFLVSPIMKLNLPKNKMMTRMQERSGKHVFITIAIFILFYHYISPTFKLRQ